MAKICLNPECKKEFIPKSDKGLYCSPACKSRHQYILKKKEAAAASVPAPTPQRPVKDITMPWIEEIYDYCRSKGMYPSDLIDFHKLHYNSDITRALMSLKKGLTSK